MPDYLPQLPLFRSLDDPQIERLLAATGSRQLEDGDWLFRRGDPAREIFVLRAGKIALFRLSADGRESIVALVGVDEIFGEELMHLPEAQRDVHARAVGRCTLIRIDRDGFRELLAECAELSRALVETLHRRQQMLIDHIERLSLQDACGRLINYLLAEVGEATGSCRLRLAMPKHTLASHLAIQPETLSRVIGRLKSLGHLSEEDDTLTIDADELRAGQLCDQCERIHWGCPGPPHVTAGTHLPLAH